MQTTKTKPMIWSHSFFMRLLLRLFHITKNCNVHFAGFRHKQGLPRQMNGVLVCSILSYQMVF